MKATQINSYGGNEVVKIIEVGIPIPSEDEVLVRTQTAGINPVDWKIRNGMGKRLGLELPIMLGGEIAGTIEAIGKAVVDFKKGDEVFGMVKTGAFAEFVLAKATDIALKPHHLDFKEAAAIPLCGLTAWQAIYDLAQLENGQRILITGASGAVGSLAVQLAKARGAYVIGTASGKNETFVTGLGADEFINYEEQAFEKIVKGVDVVFDTVGGETFEKSYLVLKSGGNLVTSVAFPSDEQAVKYGIKAVRVFCKPNAEELIQISELIKAGTLRARVSKVFPLEKVTDALTLSESGNANGKVILQIGN